MKNEDLVRPFVDHAIRDVDDHPDRVCTSLLQIDLDNGMLVNISVDRMKAPPQPVIRKPREAIEIVREGIHREVAYVKDLIKIAILYVGRGHPSSAIAIALRQLAHEQTAELGLRHDDISGMDYIHRLGKLEALLRCALRNGGMLPQEHHGEAEGLLREPH